MGYIDSSFKDLLAEKRPMEKKMKAKLEALDKDSLTALSNYYASFK